MNILAILERGNGGEQVATRELFSAMKEENFSIHVKHLDAVPNTSSFGMSRWLVSSLITSIQYAWSYPSHGTIYSTTYLGVLGPLLLRPFKHQRTVFHYHGSRVPQPSEIALSVFRKFTQKIKHRAIFSLHRYCFVSASLLCVPSTFALLSIQKEFSIDHFSSVEVIPNGVNTDTFSPISDNDQTDLRKKYHIPRNSFVCLVISRVNHEKRVLETIEFIHSIQRYSRKQVLLLLAHPKSGNDNEYLTNVERHLSLSEIPHQIFTSHPNIAELYQISDCVVSHSEQEVFPLALLEAMSCGIPYFAVPNGTTEKYLAQVDPSLILPSSEQIAARQVLASTHQRKLLEKLRAFATLHSWHASAKKLHHALASLN